MEELQLLPAEDEGVEALHASHVANPGHLWSEQNESSQTENFIWQCHVELMNKLDRHEQILNKLLNGKLMAPSEMSCVSLPSRASYASKVSKVKTVDDNEVHATLTSVSSHLQAANPNLCQSFSAFELGLKAEARAAHTETSRRKYASARMDQVIGASLFSTKKAIETVRRVVFHPAFDIFFAVVVFTNAVFIGLEVQSNMSGEWISASTVRIVNYSYAGAFILELLGRLIAAGCSFFYSEDCMWNYLDILIVATSIIEITVEALISEGGSSTVTGFKIFRIIRLTKLVKTVRLVRILRFVLALRTLVTSIAHTLKALFWALTLLGLIVYVFAILFAQAAHDASLDTSAAGAAVVGEKYFGSLPEIMLTLFMSIAGGVSWEDVIYPLIDIDIIWAFFFLFYVAFTYLAVLNVVTGVFCQSAIENAQKDQAAVVQNILDNKEAHLKKIRSLFTQLGADNTGSITYDMLKHHIRTPAVRVYFESLGLNVTDAWSFFKLLDVDGGGGVDIEEFLLGCLRLRGQARAMDIAKLSYDQQWLIKSQGKFQRFVKEELERLNQKVTTLSEKVR